MVDSGFVPVKKTGTRNSRFCCRSEMKVKVIPMGKNLFLKKRHSKWLLKRSKMGLNLAPMIFL